MSKHLSHSVYVGKIQSEKVTFTYKKIEDILGCSCLKLRKIVGVFGKTTRTGSVSKTCWVSLATIPARLNFKKTFLYSRNDRLIDQKLSLVGYY